MSLICAPYVLHFGLCNIRVQFIVFSCRLMRVSSLKAGVVSSPLGAYFATFDFLLIGGFHAISGDTNNNGEINKC